MNKELIEKLREYAAGEGSVQGYMADVMRQAADALEAKAAPVGERAQQPQIAEAVVMLELLQEGQCKLVDCEALPAAFKLQPGLHQLYTTPQPSAGVVMPESVGVLILGGIFHGGSGPEFSDIDIEPNMRVLERIQMELVNSTDDVYLELFARLNGKEVGRG